ncbi:MAG: aspartate 1-decarboxylase [Moorea sp. SIOASIH]|uniref:aspartate 1-decarboxylase n=1 Tax=Moorena sp. SIOASIH TaxID=2607817 RepID=UPI0013BE7F87|nr:aspartate 1-decarboxylase [Moorena sp. SIOASIH]NEO36428.1 aspartate 1-decarboxylase [Moorena sp. SIOASIH]
MRIMLKSKIHRAQVTEANVNYVGSITVDRTLMEKADLLPGEKVLVVDNTNGNRLETYVLEGEADSGVICMNGGSARLVSPGDLITLLAFDVTDEIKPPKKILVDENNKFLQYV